MQLSVRNGSGSKSWTIFWGVPIMLVYRGNMMCLSSFLKVSRIPDLCARQYGKCVVICRNIILQQLEYSLIIFRWAVCLTICTVWGRTERGTKAQFKRSHVSRNIYVCISCFLWTTVMMKHLFPPNPPSRNVDRPKKKKYKWIMNNKWIMNYKWIKKGCLSEGKHLLGNRISTLWGRIK